MADSLATTRMNSGKNNKQTKGKLNCFTTFQIGQLSGQIYLPVHVATGEKRIHAALVLVCTTRIPNRTHS